MNEDAEDSRDPFIQWWEEYRPTGTPAMDSGPMVGDVPRLFGTNGDDWEAVSAAADRDPMCVWTLLECDGIGYVVSGIHFVNREGYFITEVPAANMDMEICVDSDELAAMDDPAVDDLADEPTPPPPGPRF